MSGGQIIPGPDPALGYLSGGYYIADNAGQISTPTSQTLNASRLYLARLTLWKAGTFDRIACEVTTGGSAGAVMRLGIYNSGGGVPTTVLLDAGTVAATTTGAKEITISQTLARGVYFLAAAAQINTGVACRIKEEAVPGLAHFSVTSPSTQLAGYFQDSVSGAFPAYTNGIGGNISYVVRVFLRAL